MTTIPLLRSRSRFAIAIIFIFSVCGVVGFVVSSTSNVPPQLNYLPRDPGLNTSGYPTVMSQIKPWDSNATLPEIAAAYADSASWMLGETERQLATADLPDDQKMGWLIDRALIQNYIGKTGDAYQTQSEARTLAEANPPLAERFLYTIIYFQGVTALRLGEDENCIMCRGESSCILPISAAAVHLKPKGSRLAIVHFTEYLQQFPDDLHVQWLLNIAHMTLGEYPQKVDPKHLVNLDSYLKSEFDIGRFRDVGALVGVSRYNFQGGGIMDDFDNDGLLDIVTTANHPGESMSFYRNKGNGTFEERSKQANFSDQFGGLFCVQVDFNNDGKLDIFIPRGAWMPAAVRPSLLRNDGNGVFTDVTREAKLDMPLSSLSACWADFDNDGFIDLFMPCGPERSRLYRNRGDGTFEEVATAAGVAGEGGTTWRSAVWLDFDKDGYPDLFVNSLKGTATLYRNNGNRTFTNVTKAMGIDGPRVGFACWAWDYDNDGWPDIFATCYDYPVKDVVLGLQGKPHGAQSSRLYRNLGGKGFQDVTKEVGLDKVFATMGCNFGDFDNDGYLDIFLGTGGPDLAVVVPNRMFKNVAGKRFAEITGTSGTGNIQKGHSVACGDWDRNGTLDIFIEMGGVTFNSRYHNMLYQNPGQGKEWLNVKLVGLKTNRAAIGTQIKVVTAGPEPHTIYREVTSGSSFGANPLEQMIGVGQTNRIALLEITWPTSKTTQTFRDLAVNQAIEITEFATEFRKREYKPISLPN